MEGIWLWAMLSLLCILPSQTTADVCDECECTASGLVSGGNDTVHCFDKPGWQYPTSLLEDFLNTTLFVIFEDIPLIELNDPAADLQGIPLGQLIGLTFSVTEIDKIPPSYFSHDMFTSLTFLTIDRSKLSDLDALLSNIGQASSLHELVLTNNPFDTITKEMFDRHDLNKRLRYLSIGQNPITLPNDLFVGFSGHLLNVLSLNGLDVGSNEKFLEALLAPVLYQLHNLDLSDTGLQAVPAFIRRMSALKQLYLSNNAITSLDRGVDSLTRCMLYEDDYNNSTFLFNDGLEQLMVNDNQLEVLDTRALPTSLWRLDLSFNIISDIKYGFTKFRNMLMVTLKSNRIKAILPDFSNPIDNPQLIYMDLTYNRLSSLSKDWLAAYEAVVPAFPLQLFISRNPFSCLCGMAPLVEHIYLGGLFSFANDIEDIDCYMADLTSRNIFNERMNGTLTNSSDVASTKECSVTELCDREINIYNCSHRFFPAIPSDFPGSPRLIDLSHNNIPSMIPSYLDTSSGLSSGITYLDLSYNLIGPHLTQDDVKSLLQLEIINLSHNRITSVGPHTFLYNNNLHHIKLSYNYITSICHLQGNLTQSLWYPLLSPNMELDLSHNQIRGLPCNAFSMLLETDPLLTPTPTVTSVTWRSLNLSYNCIYLNNSMPSISDFYQPATSNFSGFGVRELAGTLDLSNNFISDFSFLFAHELGELSCVGELNVENNLLEYVDNTTIQEELIAKWSSCGSSLLLGNNPYDCTCPSIDFWIYYNQTDPVELQYIDFTSSMECAKPSQLVNSKVYEIDYPYCACLNESNPCFVYINNSKYRAECFELAFSNPPEATCGPCPTGFSGDGINCTAIDPCVDSPCFIDANNPSLFSACNQTGPGTFVCLGCPAGMTGNGYTASGCQNIDSCQMNKCYADPFIQLNCSDQAPPSTSITCDPCPEGLVSVYNRPECVVAGQCCEDDDPCSDNSTNLCFLPHTCSNMVWPLTGIACGPCPPGTRDISPPNAYQCEEIDSCLSSPCYNHSATPALCTDVPWTSISSGSNPYQCMCAAGMTGIGEGTFGCHEIDACVLNPCWKDLTGLKVRATCIDVEAYPGMVDPFEVICVCPNGTSGDGITVCNDIDTCLVANPCFDITSCTVVNSPFDVVVCGPCPAGFSGDGRTCVDIDECAEAIPAPACHPSLACVPTPAPHADGQYTCLGECPCGFTKVSAGRGSGGCIAIDVCSSNNPCSMESTCQYNHTGEPAVSCGQCAPGQPPVLGCQHPGTKSCCLSTDYFSFQLDPTRVDPSLNMGKSVAIAGVLQVYSNGLWGDVVYSNITDSENEHLLLTYTADAVCRHLGFPAGHVLSEKFAVDFGKVDSLLTLMCRGPGLLVMECDHSGFHGLESVCTAPENRHYVTCSYGITGFHLYNWFVPSDGEVLISFHLQTPDSGCMTRMLPVCYQQGSGLWRTATDICINLGYPGMYKELRPLSSNALPPSPYNDTNCAVIQEGKVVKLSANLSTLHISCHVGVESYRLMKGENYLQMRVGHYSYNDDGIYWGYLPAKHYMNLRPGFMSLQDWDKICQSMGFNHMVSVGSAIPSDRNDADCRSWLHFHFMGHQMNGSCGAVEMIHLECSQNSLQARVVDGSNKPSLRGRVDVKSDRGWHTLTVHNHTQVTFELATAACSSAGYLLADWWLNDDLTADEVTAIYGSSRRGGRVQMLPGQNFACNLKSGAGLLECGIEWPERLSVNDTVEDVYGRMVSVGYRRGYTLVVHCAQEPPLIELTKGHYGEITVKRNELWEPVCVDFDPACANYTVGGVTLPDSRLADTFCWSLGYGAGHTIPLDPEFDIELPEVVLGRRCSRTGYCEREVRSCDLSSGDYLVAIRCLDAWNACAAETNVCFWNDSCVDLPINELALCYCPPGYEGDGVNFCTDIDECADDLNPCFDSTSCVPVPAPSILGEIPVDGPTCSPCPEGTVDADESQPGRICLESNGCIPNYCNDPKSCVDVERSLDIHPGYTCGPCGTGYVPSLDLGCFLGNMVAGSIDCCIDADACVGRPCGEGKKCFDLPAPAPIIGGFTCGACPTGTQHNFLNNRCEDINYCQPPLNPCDKNAFCEDLPPPSLNARCRCHAGYYQDTTAFDGTCLEVDLCSLEPGICGVGRVCYDIPPPNNPHLFDAPTTVCSSCAAGYLSAISFTITLEHYLSAKQANTSLKRDCTEYDGCANRPDACYRFPGNAAYDVECVDVPAIEYIPNGITFRCMQCPNGMSGNGYGDGGCSNIDSCQHNPCDDVAESCIDFSPPRHGFLCVCPFGTIGVGPGNSRCIDFDACQGRNNPCLFPATCVDLPYNSDKPYRCDCPLGTYHVSERACGDINGCIQRPCYGECTDVPYTDIGLYPDSNGTDVICEPCPFGTTGNGIGWDGCIEIDLCSSFSYAHLLCYNNPRSGLAASCVDVPYHELLPTDPIDLYRCVCANGMQGTGEPFFGCSNIDYCELDVCANNTVCKDFDPPSTEFTCRCAAGYEFEINSEECIEMNYCGSPLSPCDPRMTCIDYPSPSDPYSKYYPIVNCSACPVGTIGSDVTIHMLNGVVTDTATCEEINGCLWTDICWVNPFTLVSLCEDVPWYELNPAVNTGYESRCRACPHGLAGSGDTAGGDDGCTEVNGCKVNRCFVRVECYDILSRDLLLTQPADSYTCGSCPGDLVGDGKTCTGGCDFDTDLCGGEVVGSWHREVGLLSERTKDNINESPKPGEAPLFDHTQPYSTKGRFLTVDSVNSSVSTTSKFLLPQVQVPGVFNVVFYFYYNGVGPGTLCVRQYWVDGTSKTLWTHDSDKGTEWHGVETVFALSNIPFQISFEHTEGIWSVGQMNFKGAIIDSPPYVAVDDIYVDRQEDWQCHHNQLCGPQAVLCLRYPDGYDYNEGKDYKCYCSPSFTGQYCESKVDVCASSPCEGSSTCVPADGHYTCVCPPTLTGSHCEEDVNECEIEPLVCAYGGTCANYYSGYRCSCLSGLTGISCRANTDDCVTAYCGYGICYDLRDNYTCVCSDGWEGLECTTNVGHCLHDPCLHSSKCTDDSGTFICDCPVGYSGPTCEVDIDDCRDVQCQQGGSCLDRVNDFECKCPGGYGGKLCEKDVWACNVNTCNGNGICHEGIDDPRCLCTEPGCQKGLDCTPVRGKHLCQCDYGYRGSDCELPPDPCYRNPCLHGTCHQLNSQQFDCVCHIGYEGPLCQTDINECIPNPCLNSLTCFNMEGSFDCQCMPGFGGENCAIDLNDCNHQLCQNEATCRDRVNGFECICSKSFFGEFCQLSASDMVASNIPSSGSAAALQGSRYSAMGVDSAQCTTWSALERSLKIEILGYSVLAVILLVLFLLFCALHRIKSGSKQRDDTSLINTHPSPVRRYADGYPLYGGQQLNYSSPRFLSSTELHTPDDSHYLRRPRDNEMKAFYKGRRPKVGNVMNMNRNCSNVDW